MFSQYLINTLGPTFGPLYEPGYVPKGYVPQGGPYVVPTTMEAEPTGRRVVLNYKLVQQYKTRYCYLNVLQHRRGSSRGPSIARRAIEDPSETVVKVAAEGTFVYPGYRAEYIPAHGIELYVSGPYLIPNPEGDQTSTEYWFEREGTWFNIETWAWAGCNAPSLNEIAKVATSLTISG